MKYLHLLFLTIITCLTTSAQLVVQVYDGDTYKILDKGNLQVIRLANVDAPELGQYYGIVAKNAVSKLILSRIVKIQVFGKDRFGRTIATVRVDGKRLDSLLLRNGWAWHWRKYSHHYYLSFYEGIAQKAKRGMWRCQYNVPPWVWRNLNKKQKRLNEMCR